MHNISIDLEELKLGYKLIPLDSKEIIDQALIDAELFFKKSKDYKRSFIKVGCKEFGYHELAQKEFYALRNIDVPVELNSAITCFNTASALAIHCLKNIADLMQWDMNHLKNLIKNYPLPNQGKSSTVFRILHYYGGNSNGFGCDVHQDLGLISIVFCQPSPALEVFNYQYGNWVSFENQCSTTMAVLMVGEALSKITNGVLLPCTHRVRRLSNSRFSIVYQLRVDENAIIDSRYFESPITDKISKHFVLTGKNFYEQEAKGRTSVNGSY